MPRISSAAASTRAHIPGRSHLLFITSSAEASAAQPRLTAGLSMTRLKLMLAKNRRMLSSTVPLLSTVRAA